MAPFRACYSRLHEFRSLTPKRPMIALTATAAKVTKDTIFDVLMLNNPKVICESANKTNISYSVEYIDQELEIEHYFSWIVDDLIEKKEMSTRTIIYTQTIKQ